MKATGIVRHLDELGRVVIPKELRRTLGIANGDPVEIYTEGDKIIINKFVPGCCLCGKASEELVPLYPEKRICKPCIGIIVTNEENLLKYFNAN
ncbi:MAG: AbrB/MazE/SpoVT family DNA-binding domain-containing protein [Bacillota bacterium]